MKPLIHKVRHKTRKHRTFLLIIVVIFVGGFFVNAINGIYTENKIVSSFQKNYEKQAQEQLSAYNFGLQALLQTRLTNQLGTLSKIADEPQVQTAISSKNYGLVENEFRNLIDTDNRFDNINIFDQNGIARLSVNKQNDKSAEGSDFSYRDYFKAVQSTKQPYIGYAIRTVRGNDVIPFTVPVLDAQGNLVGVVAAASTLTSVAGTLVLPNDLPGLYFALVDSQGNLPMSKGQAPAEISNIKDRDLLVLELISGGSGNVRAEINYLDDEVFAQGSTTSVGGNNFYIASYYLQSKYDHDLAVITDDYDRALFTSRVRSVAMFLLGGAVVFWIIKRHEATEEE